MEAAIAAAQARRAELEARLVATPDAELAAVVRDAGVPAGSDRNPANPHARRVSRSRRGALRAPSGEPVRGIRLVRDPRPSTSSPGSVSPPAAAMPSSKIDITDLSVSLGLGESLARNAVVSRTLARLVAFDAARRQGDTLAVRLALPDLPERRLTRLSYSARLAHERFATARAASCWPALRSNRR